MVSKRQHNEGANGNANEGSRGDDNINDYANDDDDENLEINIIFEADAPNSTFFAQNSRVSLLFFIHFCHTLTFSVPFLIVLA